MSERKDVEKLQSYKRKILDGVQVNLKKSISKLNDTVSMVGDFQEICSVLFELIQQQENQLEVEILRNNKLKTEIEAKSEALEQMREKSSEYEKMEVDAVEIANLASILRKEESKLKRREKELEKEKEGFKKEKEEIINAKEIAEERAEKSDKEKNEAVISRDEAIADRRDVIEEKEKIQERIAELEDEREWYRGYAEALDKKIADYFGGQKKEYLEMHYNDYLCNPEKWEEHKRYFPKFQINVSDEGNEEESGQQVENEADGEYDEGGGKPEVEKEEEMEDDDMPTRLL